MQVRAGSQSGPGWQDYPLQIHNSTVLLTVDCLPTFDRGSRVDFRGARRHSLLFDEEA